MATIIQQLKGTAAEIAAKTYAVGVLVWNETNKRWHGGDGVTAGGIPMARYDERNDGSIGYLQEVKTDTYAVVAEDNGKVLVANKATAMMFNLGAVATLGAKFVFIAKNIGAGALSITPNGAETIDGVAGAINLPTGSSVMMKCDGTNWRTFFSNGDVTGASIHNSTEKTVLADTDEFGVADSAAAWLLKKVTLLNLAKEMKWRSRGIGELYMADTSKAGVDVPPSSHSSMVWVELTAGLTGPGGFNDGKLTSETVSGSYPLVTATAIVSVSSSPLFGQSIDLINTEGRILRPSSSPGTKQNDALQNITGSVGMRNSITSSTAGAFTTATGDGNTRGDGGSISGKFNFDASLVARTDVETRMKNVGVKAYMRVK